MSLEYPCVYHEAGMCYLNPEEPEGCVFGPCSQETPSNADRIRAMSDEELAQWLAFPVCKYAGCAIKCPVIQENKGAKCDENILEWLRQPAEED